MVKNLPAKQEIWVRSLGLEDSPEECMATYSSILAWRILMDRGAWFNICLHVNNEWLKFKINELKDILMQIHSIFIYKCSITCVLFTQSCWLFASPWTVAHQAPLSTGFSWQEYWNGFPFPPPGDLPEPGIKPMSLVSPALQEEALLLSHQGSPHFN